MTSKIVKILIVSIAMFATLSNSSASSKPAHVERIIALAPHLVEISYAVGLGENLVAAVDYSDYPEAAKSLPRVGGYSGINIEAIVRLKPDLILAWRSGNPAKQLKQLEDLGFRIHYSEPNSLEGIADLMQKIASIGGASSGSIAVNAYRQRLGKLRQRYKDQSKISVFYQVWNKPLQTLNGESIVSDVIELCGGFNVFASAKTIAPKVSVETVLRRNPQVIIASGMGEERPEWLDDWRQWPQLQAVREEQLFFVPPDYIQRHSPRLLEGAEILCDQLQSVRRKKQQR